MRHLRRMLHAGSFKTSTKLKQLEAQHWERCEKVWKECMVRRHSALIEWAELLQILVRNGPEDFDGSDAAPLLDELWLHLCCFNSGIDYRVEEIDDERRRSLIEEVKMGAFFRRSNAVKDQSYVGDSIFIDPSLLEEQYQKYIASLPRNSASGRRARNSFLALGLVHRNKNGIEFIARGN